VAFAYRTQFSSEPIERFAAMIAGMAPAPLNRVFFTTSGSDATEIGARFARQYHLERGEDKRYLIVSRWLSYHGITLDALSMSGLVVRRKDFVPTLVSYPKIPACYCYRCPYQLQYPQCNIACARKLEEEIQLAGPEYVSAFIAEPVVGAAAGAISPPPEYFAVIRDICTRYGVLLIVDEIMTGFGRTGANFAVDHWKAEPDIILFAKGASAGYWPTAGIIVSDNLYSAVRDGSGVFSPGHTYSGTPLMGSVGVKVLEYIEKHGLVRHVAETGPYLMEGLNSLRTHPIVGDVRGMGFFTGIEFVRDKATKAPFEFKEFSKVSNLIVRNAFEKGLMVYPGGGTVDGHKGDHILVAPPLITTKEEIDRIVQMLDAAISEVEAELL
jgi:adenosylmethionine-8-amino-7-oxononanoate aminotransferase